MSLYSYLILIPARAGSKRVPNKNIVEISGKSLIQRAICGALNILPKNQIFLSTDSIQFAQIGKINGINVHIRAFSAALDSAVASDVLQDFLKSESMQHQDLNNHSIIYLQPTSPFRLPVHISDCMKLHEESGGRPIVSVRNSPVFLQKLIKKNVLGHYDSLVSETSASANGQSLLDEFLLPNGAIYVFKITDFIERKTFPINGCIAYKMDDLRSLDIDSTEDIYTAEQISKSLGW